ncbi:hypothetical protein [Streptomyces netropsis]|uniref:Lipoprotein n=1 Tax=Streptomyces netropsis TaxID=55404 RepID=A0A7W7LFU5_STRNE|nr:hypothetical protein [Streptomyces netropsis]MBB4889259.1 hypothetical protein [Streptomyces netropsis]GGR47093.1 hypothetical protein GCM10010219_60770 [Streptomyces netropsis]
MHHRSKVLYGMLASALGIALTACGGDGGGEESGASEGRTAKSGSGKASPATRVEWSPALAMGQSAPELYEPRNSAGGKFQVTATKVVKGTQKQMKDGHYVEADRTLEGRTPYFVYVTYLLKEGKPGVANPDLNAHAVVLDENGDTAAKRPVVHSGYVEGGCPVGDIYMGWDVGEKRTLCSIYIGDPSKRPARLAWSTAAETADDYKKGASWAWTAQ